MDVLVVMTSHEQLGATGYPTGLWFHQLAGPYFLFRDAGAELTMASPEGGHPPIDPRSEAPPLSAAVERFRRDDDARTMLADTLRLDQVDPAEFHGVFYVGGYGVLWDLADDPASRTLLEWRGRHQRPVAMVDHAPAALRHALGAESVPLVRNRRVTGFSHSEEVAAGFVQALPFVVEEELRRLGARFSSAPHGAPHVVRDGFLVTGQNTASAGPAARLLLDVLQADDDG